jgi:predicted sugar kinase
MMNIVGIVAMRWMSDYCSAVGRAWFGIGFALRRPRIAVEIWRGSTRLRAASC